MNFYALGWAIGATLSESKTFTPLDFGVKTRKRCQKGYNCGGSCINTKKKCRVALSGEAKNFAQYVRQNKGKLTAIQKEKAKEQNIGLKAQSRLKREKPKKATTSQPEKLTTSQHPPNSAAFFTEKGQKTLKVIDSASIEKLTASAKEVRSLMDNTELTRKQRDAARKNRDNEKVYELNSQLDQNWNRINNLITENEPILKKVHDQLLQNSRVSDEQIKQEIGRLSIDKKALKAHPELTSYLEDYVKMTGKIPDNVSSIVYTRKRPYASDSEQLINIGERQTEGSKYSLFHELAHFEEYKRPNIGEAAAEWREQKAANFAKDGQPKTKTLRTLVPDAGYGSDEKALEDKYMDPYVGKIYPSYPGRSITTEVVSMGIQQFASPRQMTELYLKDPSHFELSLGILSSLREN